MRRRKIFASLVLCAVAMFGGAIAKADTCQPLPAGPPGTPSNVCVRAEANDQKLSACVVHAYTTCAGNEAAQTEQGTFAHCTTYSIGFYTIPTVPPVPPLGVPFSALWVCGGEHAGQDGVNACEGGTIFCAAAAPREDGADAETQRRHVRVDATGVRYDRGNTGPYDSCDIALPGVFHCGSEHVAASPDGASAQWTHCTQIFPPLPLPTGAYYVPCDSGNASPDGATLDVTERTNTCVHAMVDPKGGGTGGSIC